MPTATGAAGTVDEDNDGEDEDDKMDGDEAVDTPFTSFTFEETLVNKPSAANVL